jgi:hypothetical protein
VPRVAERHADAQLAPPCLRAGGVQHAGAQDTELELADAAFHAKQKPVIGTAWIIDRLVIYHPRLDQPAEFEEMVPVPAIACEPRGIQAQHRPDLAGA